MAQTMRALLLTRSQTTSTPFLSIESLPIPQPGPGEILVKIRASAIQPADILNSQGGFPHTRYPRTPGKDFSGTVVSGPQNQIGQHVFGTSGSTFSFTVDGAQAEYAVTPVNAIAPKPFNLSFAQAATLGTPLTTADLTLQRASIKPSDTVLVLGATGSVGSFVLQIASKIHGCKTLAVGHRSAPGIDINSSSDPTLQTALTLTDGKGPDIVVDTVGDFALAQAALKILAYNGRMSFISAPRGGKSTELPVDILSLYRRQISLVGCNSAGEKQDDLAEMLKELRPKFESGELQAPEEGSWKEISLEEAPEAYAGKIKKAVIVFPEGVEVFLPMISAVLL